MWTSIIKELIRQLAKSRILYYYNNYPNVDKHYQRTRQATNP